MSKIDEKFLNEIEDFLEACGESGKILYNTDGKSVHKLEYNGKTLVLISRKLGNGTAIFGDKMGFVPFGFISHIIDALGLKGFEHER